jgi:hypothetical protein
MALVFMRFRNWGARCALIVVIVALLLVPATRVAGAIALSTFAATKITGDTAQLNGRVDDLGGYINLYAWFEWGLTTEYGQSTSLNYMTVVNTIFAQLDDLDPATTYHYRIAAVPVPLLGQIPQTRYGADQTFTTTSQPSKAFDFHSIPATNIGQNSATFNARILNMGKYQSAMVWFEWGINNLYGHATPLRRIDGALPFQDAVTGLSPGTVYHWRAVLRSTLTGASNVTTQDMTLKTLDAGLKGPSLVTKSAADVSQTSATLAADISLPSQIQGAQYWFEWGNAPVFREASAPINLQNLGTVKLNVNGLNPGNNYQYRTGLTFPGSSGAVYYSDNVAFTTASAEYAMVIARVATSIRSTSATLNAYANDLAVRGIQKAWFEWDDTLGNSNSTPVIDLSSSGPFSAGIEGLIPATRYRYRAVVLANGMLNPSASLEFSTAPSSAPVIRTLGAQFQTAGFVVFRGELDFNSSISSAKVWIEYGKDTNYGMTTAVQTRLAPGAFSIGAEVLDQSEEIHFRAFGEVAGERISGQDLSVSRKELLNQQPDDKMTARADGDTALITTSSPWQASADCIAWLEWGLTTNYSHQTQPVVLTKGDTYSVFLQGLSQNTFYHYRMIILTGNTLIKGRDQLFNCGLKKSLTVLTLAPESFTDTTATLRGRVPVGLRGMTQTWFDWGATENFTTSTVLASISPDGEASIRLTGLRRNTLYHYRFVAATGIDFVTGVRTTFRTALLGSNENQVILETTPPVDLSAQSATLTGRIESLGGRPRLNLWFEYGPNLSLGSITDNQSITSPGSFRASIKGLTPGSTYYYRLVVSTDNSPTGRVETPPVSFNTPLPSTPMFILRTLPPTNLGSDSAQLRGSIDYLWNYPSLQCWFDWGNTLQYGNQTPVTMVSSAGIVESQVKGLLPGVTYHYRLSASSPSGVTLNGADVILKTMPGKVISVLTGSATEITTDSARVNGQIASMGSSEALSAYFEWGPTAAYGDRTQEQLVGTVQNISSRLTGLKPNVSYHYRLVAVSLGETKATAIGEDRTFTTIRSTPPAGLFGCQGPG